jgi:uncharacterized membrane protein YfcA
MAWELIASGTGGNIYDMTEYETQVEEEQRARIDFQFITPVPTFQIDALRNSLVAAGVTEVQVSGVDNIVRIYYRKGALWVPVIISLVLVLAIVIVAWLFFKEVSNDLPAPVISTVLIGAAILSAAIAYTLFRRKY